MADLAAADAGHAADFTDGERREVVVEHEAALLLAFVGFHALGVVGGAEGGGDEGLGFAAGEEGGAVDAGEDADLDGDGADLIEGAVVGADAVVEDLVAEDLFAEKLVVLGELLARRSASSCGEFFLELVLDLLDEGVGVELGVLLGVEGVLEAVADLARELVEVGLVDLDFARDCAWFCRRGRRGLRCRRRSF